MVSKIANRIEVAWWVYLPALGLICVAFSYIQAASNDLKQEPDPGSYTSPPFAYTVAQWLALIFGALLQLTLVAVLIWLPLLNDVERLQAFPSQSTYSNQDYAFSLTMHGDGWEQVNTGAYSDGSAVAEFGGSAEDHYILVFIIDQNDSANDQLQYRLEQIRKNESSRIKCENTRTIDEPSMTLVSTLDCSGRTTFGEYLREISYIREIGDHRIEVLGRIAAPRLTKVLRESDLEQTVKSLSKIVDQPIDESTTR